MPGFSDGFWLVDGIWPALRRALLDMHTTGPILLARMPTTVVDDLGYPWTRSPGTRPVSKLSQALPGIFKDLLQAINDFVRRCHGWYGPEKNNLHTTT